MAQLQSLSVRPGSMVSATFTFSAEDLAALHPAIEVLPTDHPAASVLRDMESAICHPAASSLTELVRA